MEQLKVHHLKVTVLVLPNVTTLLVQKGQGKLAAFAPFQSVYRLKAHKSPETWAQPFYQQV